MCVLKVVYDSSVFHRSVKSVQLEAPLVVGHLREPLDVIEMVLKFTWRSCAHTSRPSRWASARDAIPTVHHQQSPAATDFFFLVAQSRVEHGLDHLVTLSLRPSLVIPLKDAVLHLAMITKSSSVKRSTITSCPSKSFVNRFRHLPPSIVPTGTEFTPHQCSLKE